MNTTYRSVYSGREIDEAIASMKAGSGLTISNDFLGGRAKAASAELAKILNNRLLNLEDVSKLRDLLETIPDFNIYTNADHDKLVGINTGFKGVFINSADRDSKIGPDTIKYLGNEYCIVLDNGSGFSEIQRWFRSASSWIKIKLSGVGDFEPILAIGANTEIPLFAFKTDQFNTMKVLVSAGTNDGTQRHVQEISMTAIGYDTHVSIYGELGNAQLFTVNSVVINNVASLSITTAIPNLKVNAKQLALI